MGQIVCRDVSADVVHRNQRLACRQCHTLGVVDADQQRTDQPWRIGHRHGVDALEGLTGVVQRLLYDGTDVFGVAPRGNLRHNAAILFVFLHLRVDDRA